MRILTLALANLVSLAAFSQVKPTSASERMRSVEKRKQLEQKSLVNHISFRNIGPSVMSGRVDDIEANPDDPTEFYVAYATGGLWHTTNNGLSFKSIFDSADVIGIGDIAVNWKTRTIWVGTGEVNSSRSSYAGLGLYRSKDNGKNWEYLGLPESHHIGKVQLHPTDDNTAWVAVLGHLYSPNKERGIYKTTDGGKTWKQTLYVDENTGAVEMEMNPQNPNELYAAMWYRTRKGWNFEESGKTSGLYKSTDGGETWKNISTPASGLPTGDVVGRMGIAISPKNPQIVYVIVDNQQLQPDTAKRDTSVYVLNDFKNLTAEQFANLNNARLDTFLKRNDMRPRYTAAIVKEMVATGKVKPTAVYDYLYVNTGFEARPIGAEVYRSDDGGQSWKKTNQKDIPIFFTYGYYFAKIYVSPSNPDKVVVLGLNPYLSTDGGKTWKNIAKNNVHSDHHALWINPKKDSHMINGNDGGINITYDNGDVWFFANTPPVGQFYGIAVDNARPYNVYGGLQDNGTWYTPSVVPRGFGASSEDPAKRLGGGDGMQVQVDLRDNTTIYLGSQFGAYFRTNRLNPVRENVKQIDVNHSLGEKPVRFNWQTPILLSSHNQDIVYFAANKLYRSFNKADTMVAISPDLTKGPRDGDVPFGTITAISESPLRFGLIYAGTDDGNIHVTKDGGLTWTDISKKLPQNLYVTRVIASAHKEGRVYATLNGYRFDNFMPYLFISEDYGNTWKQLGNDLPEEPVNVVREDVRNENILYVGTDGGLYVTADMGNSFMMWNKGLPKSIPVHDIAIQNRENEIVLGTHGRSLYIGKLDDVQKIAQKK